MDRNEEGWRGTKKYGDGLGGVEWDGENGEGLRWMKMDGDRWKFSVLIEPFLATQALSYLI